MTAALNLPLNDSSREKKNPASKEKPPLKILVVEDNPGDAELLRVAFRRLRPERTIEMIHVELLHAAIDFLKTHSVDAIVLDLSLPDSSGFVSIELINQTVPHIPVIVFTGWDDRNAALQGIRSGAQDYLIKGSFDYVSIISTIDYAIERQKIKNVVEGSRLQIQQESEFKKEVLEVVAHDLRSPLAGVILQLEGILKGDLINLNPDQKKIFQQMYNNCKQVIELSNELLDLDSLKSKDFLKLQEVDLTSYIRKTFDSFAPLAARKAIHMHLSLPQKLPLLSADPKRIAQALNNLISNAIKFSFQKTEIEVAVKVEKNDLIFSVKDQGQGIPEEDKSKLFLEFSRTRIRPTAGEDSAGIGLAIVKNIIDAHMGELSVETVLGEGSTFAFSIPIQLKKLN
ncbi:MAG: histidine kinase,Response regulator receiver domain proteinhistidine kinase [Bacteriovoracaceae bacterium]|nr:histidine kinase,Response regulator receiver domain proteinhistidine kinase [Bacteriovoracaceae bacterium]